MQLSGSGAGGQSHQSPTKTLLRLDYMSMARSSALTRRCHQQTTLLSCCSAEVIAKGQRSGLLCRPHVAGNHKHINAHTPSRADIFGRARALRISKPLASSLGAQLNSVPHTCKLQGSASPCQRVHRCTHWHYVASVEMHAYMSRGHPGQSMRLARLPDG